MKILLDECITKRLKPFFAPGHTVYTVSEMGWNGVKNGKLITLCIENSFDILLTIDKGLLFQQSISDLNITLCILDSESSKVEELVKFIPAFEKMSSEFRKGKSYIIKLD